MTTDIDLPRIVHLGIGNFHRAHQAWYTAHAGGWSITGVAMSNTSLRDQLAQRDNSYTLATRSKEGLQTETLSIYSKVLVAKEHPNLVIEEIARPSTKLVTLTITEKGYHLKPNAAVIDLDDEAVKFDLSSDTPQTAIGILAAGLALRSQTSSEPITILSCDNISGNGRKLGEAVSQFCKAKDLHLDDWLAQSVSFPDCMVDRITPASSTEILEEIAEHANEYDPTAVLTESFSEWVIEDSFANSRPDWEKAGALIVASVTPFENRKLRLLNASHSFLAYAGILRGHRYVHEAIADPELRAGVERLWDEAAATLPPEVIEELQDYREALVDRFSVPEMRHELQQIAMDGSLKLRERLVPIVLERAEHGDSFDQSLTAIASWLRFVLIQNETNTRLRDANADLLQNLLGKEMEQLKLCREMSDVIGLSERFAKQLEGLVFS